MWMTGRRWGLATPEVVGALLAAGANIEARDADDWTPPLAVGLATPEVVMVPRCGCEQAYRVPLVNLIYKPQNRLLVALSPILRAGAY